ncbi:MAG: type II/IV secretion system protein [Armatimonadetes bacterium]|nr:type II/IV secretion system protein [Armatimonadota bacterium]
MDQRLIGQILVDNTSLTEEQLSDALRVAKETGEFIGQILVNMGMISEREAVICRGLQWNVPFVDLTEFEIDGEAAHTIPEDVMRKHACVAIGRNNGALQVAMADPNDIRAIDAVRVATKFQYRIDPCIALSTDVLNAINQLGDVRVRVAGELEGLLGEFEEPEVVEAEEESEGDGLQGSESAAGDAPVVKLVRVVITKAVQQRASDIHVQPEEKFVRVRYRIDGVLRDAMRIPKSAQLPTVSRIKVIAGMKIDQKLAPQGGRIGMRLNGRPYDFRVSTLPSQHGEKVVMRVLDKGSVAADLGKLGFSSQVQERFEKLIMRPHGIVLTTGPTGSGKSTTLYAALARINTSDKNTITAEDPVEYEMSGLTQCAVNQQAGMTFSAILREMLRQDPDIIMVGEIRDRETAVIATEAALTGHLVLSTLHTNDAAGAIPRLVEMGVEPYLVASAMSGVLAQRLVRKICPHCKVPYTPPPDALAISGIQLEDVEHAQFYTGEGCGQCDEGYRGRIGIYELLTVDEHVREMTLRGEPSHVIRAHAIQQQGMVTLKGDAIAKVLQGITTLEEALAKTQED